MKICFKCKKKKELFDFYKHSGMKDGHLNKCKECTKIDSEFHRNNKMSNDPNFHENEKKRHREKYHRLNYKEKYKPTVIAKKQIMARYKSKYPEKILAKNSCSYIKAPIGTEKHHWSYNKLHFKDLLFLNTKDHNIAHRMMIYDQERCMYRTTDGVLLDTKKSHIEYINRFIDNKTNE